MGIKISVVLINGFLSTKRNLFGLGELPRTAANRSEELLEGTFDVITRFKRDFKISF